ncbi:hypothetical protein SERLADRAFT_404496 [Serpula lacrymans var. lacrymans S7.9]|uniref:Uncharacterized protein n=1 Tax=Serpula lacrymans var. lacrymans (strain S7.9) TaxID=578457 RepID=F8NDJ1_SERL9|nr:uncharacterized protein SERLADRAFT_404496 [Serpula lacrymans var. lacrymans S7.9]EGO30224.1 hypothetical protein SERLADRAFT_404496 [Serpula lacrymans var. lacrymans S7.9]
MIGDIQVIVSASTIIIIIALSESVSRVKCFAALDSLNFIKIVCFSVPYFTPSPESNNQHPIYKIDGSANRVIAKACQDLNSWFQGARTHLTILAPSSTFDTCWADNTNTLSGGFFFQPALPMLSLQADGIRPGLFSLAPDFDSGFDQPFQNSGQNALFPFASQVGGQMYGHHQYIAATSTDTYMDFPSGPNVPAQRLELPMAQPIPQLGLQVFQLPHYKLIWPLTKDNLPFQLLVIPAFNWLHDMSFCHAYRSDYAMYFIKHNKFPESLTDEVLAVVIYAVQWELSGCLTGFYNPGHRFNEAPSRVYYDKALAAIQDLSSKERVILDGIFCALLVKGMAWLIALRANLSDLTNIKLVHL